VHDETTVTIENDTGSQVSEDYTVELINNDTSTTIATEGPTSVTVAANSTKSVQFNTSNNALDNDEHKITVTNNSSSNDLTAIKTEEALINQANMNLDVVAVYDSTYSYNFDDPGTGNNGDFLEGPEGHPDQIQTVLSNVTTRRDLDEATLTQTWDDTSNSQFIALSNDGGSSYTTANNTSSTTVSFGSSSKQIRAKMGMSRYGSQNDFPKNGFKGQTVSVHELTANIQSITPSGIGIANVRAIISPNTINGTTVKEAGELDANDNLLTHAVFADRTIEADQRLISSESVRWANP